MITIKSCKQGLIYLGLICLTLFPAIANNGVAHATERSFSAGSYIISSDSCWQPNGDTSNTIAQPAYCDTNKNNQSIFQLFGMLYALLDTGDQPDSCINNDGSSPQQKALFGYCKQIKVYWIIDSSKSTTQGADLTLNDATATSSKPIITIYNSTQTGTVAPMSTYTTKANSGTATSIQYKGGPFVIDVNDLTDAEFTVLKNKFPSVKLHKANIGFSGNVDKVLVGKPPKVAVLNEGASDVLESYIRAAGSFAWRNVVFQYVEARDIIAGCLEDPVPDSCKTKRSDITAPFQLLWAPHWIVESQWGDGSTPTVAEQQSVIGKIREFIERGNSGFFECASIESMEGSISADGTKSAGLNIGTKGGFTIGSSNVVPRIQTNGGCSDTGSCATDYLKFEETPFWLTQCGGWKYGATGGHVHNMRPNMAKSYSYLTTKTANDSATSDDDRYIGTQLKRFIHDDATKLNSSYSPGTGGSADYYVYDYLVGGRINGSPSQGYIVYLPGHSYIKCNNTNTYSYPPSRTFELTFNADPPLDTSDPASNNNKIYIEAVHTGCTQGSTCPKVEFNMITGIGTRVSGTKIDLSAEFAAFDSGSNRLSGVMFTSSDPNATTDLQITDLYVTFNGNGGIVKLTNVADLTEIDKRQSLCAPDATSTISPVSSVRCSLANPASYLTLTFSEDISTQVSKTVAVKLSYTGGPVTATYDLQSPPGASALASAGNITLDMRSAVYDAANKTLSNIKVQRGATCADVNLSDIEVTFPGSATLDLVYNDTTATEVCSPAHASPATCSGVTLPVTTAYSINTELYWQSLTPPANTALKLTYTCSPACTASSITASRGNIVTNADLTLDFKNISASSTKLSNIKLTILDGNKTVTVSKVLLTYTGSTSNNRTVSYKDTTNNDTFFSVSTKTNPAEQTVTQTIPKQAPVAPPSTWTYLIGKGICSYYVSPYLSSCDIDWTRSNTCGIKYVLNTFLALKYQSVSNEYSKTQPIVKDFIEFKSSYDYPSYRGHLKMRKVPVLKTDGTYTSSSTIWDSASTMPTAGISAFPSAPLSATDTSSPRYIFTNLPNSWTHLKFDPVSYGALDSTTKTALRTQLAAGDDNTAIVTINTVRGRKGASTADVYASTSSCTPPGDGTNDYYGCDEDSKRLWGIENSTPALKVKSKLVETSNSAQDSSAISGGKDRRDRVLFAGADDGMLHAFEAGRYNVTNDNYPDSTSGHGNGKEIWAYIPSTLLPYLKDQPFNPDPANEATFEPKVAIDGSPKLDDFIFKLSTSPERWGWRTVLVGTASVRSINQGIVFALDVTDQYNPKLLWEHTYADTSVTDCSGTSRNCNMGKSAGVSIGKVVNGDKIKNYAFLTSSWKEMMKPKSAGTGYEICGADKTGCFYGVSGYALEIETGNVVWRTLLPYTADAVGINEASATPALMDRDNNGSFDFVVFGDMQGRVWALNTTDGLNITGTTPAYQVKTLDSAAKDAVPVTYTNSVEPIGAPVAVYRDYVVLGTGGANYALDSRDYRVELIRIKSSGGEKVCDTSFVTGYTLNGVATHGEKVWAQPTITDDLKVHVYTAKSYYSNQTVSSLQSVGRVIDLAIPTTGACSMAATYLGGSNVADQLIAGGIVGGAAIDNGKLYITTLKAQSITAGSGLGSNKGCTSNAQCPTGEICKDGVCKEVAQTCTSTADCPTGKKCQNGYCTDSTSVENPFKILWWKKL